MSTRGFVGVVVDKKLVVGLFNHFDSYPGGLGADVIDFARELKGSALRAFKKNCKSVIALREGAPYAVEGVSDAEKALDVLAVLLTTEKLKIPQDRNFPKDSLFCEFAYVLDLDMKTIEFYKGFQDTEDHKPQKGNRFGCGVTKHKGCSGYYPCALIGKLKFSEATPKQMYALFPQDDDDDDTLTIGQRVGKFVKCAKLARSKA